MGKQQLELPPPWKSEWSCSTRPCWNDVTLTVYQGKWRKNVCILSTCTQVWAPLVGQRQHECLWRTTTPSTARRSKGRGRWPVAVFYNIIDLAGINAASQGAPGRRARRKVLQLRAEYMEGKWAAAVSIRWAAAETDMEAVPVRKSWKRNQTSVTWNLLQALVW